MKFSHLGLIGDVHAEAQRLQGALDFMRAAGVEQILCVGDIVDGPGDVNQCCELLKQAGVVVVRGNHDRWLMTHQMRDLPQATHMGSLNEQSRTFLQSRPATQIFQTIEGPLLLCHGLGTNDMQRLTPDDYGYALEVNDELQRLIRQRQFRFVVGGHTHRRMVRHFGYLTVVNAGTLYNGHEPCFATADFKSNTIQFYDFRGDTIEVSGPPITISAN